MERAEATRLGLPRYTTGRPCARGHVGERYTRNRQCVPCRLERWAAGEQTGPCDRAGFSDRHHTPSSKEKISAGVRLCWTRPGFAEQHRKATKAALATPDVRARMRASGLARWAEQWQCPKKLRPVYDRAIRSGMDPKVCRDIVIKTIRRAKAAKTGRAR